MFSAPSVCMATTRPCPCSPRARPIPGAVGSTFAMIAPSAGGHRRRRCSTTRATEAASILEAISPIGRACSRPMPTAATVSSMLPSAQPGPILEAACWAHARRPFFALADIEASARRKAEGKAPAPISPLGAGGRPAHRCPVRDRARRSMAGAPRSVAPSARI